MFVQPAQHSDLRLNPKSLYWGIKQTVAYGVDFSIGLPMCMVNVLRVNYGMDIR